MNCTTSIKSKTLLILLLATALISCQKSANTTNALMSEYETNGRSEIGSPFTGAVLIAKKGEIVFKEAYGLYNREENIPNTINTKFPIGSVTKQFTAMLVMQMVEEGRIKLEDSVSTHLKYLPKEFGDKLTIHHLLSNTSGLPHYEGFIKKGMSIDSFISNVYTPRGLATLVSKVELIYEPGTTFYYSSLGYMLLGAILEEVSEKSFSELLKIKIAKPLGLKNTGFASNEFILNETAKGYTFEEDKTYKMIFMKYGGEFQEASFRDQSNTYTAGGMHSTVNDLFIWSEAIRTNILLSKEFTKKMLTPNKHGYCYGWIRNWDDLIERNNNVSLFSHSGSTTGHASSINLFDDGTTIIFTANVNRIKNQEIIHQLYLKTHKLKDNNRSKGYPDRGSLKEFEKDGGIKALNIYFKKLSKLCGYEVLPSDTSIGHIMYLYYENGNQKVGDSIKQSFFKNYSPTESSINRLGYDLLDSNCKLAIDFFKENSTRYPESANAWDSLGEGFIACGDYKEAIISFTRAVEIGKKTNHHNLIIFKDNLQKAKTELQN